MKVLALVSDAFGGRCGIAKFNRDLLSAICSHPGCDEVIAVPRVISESVGELPDKLTMSTWSALGKLPYAGSLARVAMTKRFDAIICGHLNLLPFAAAMASMRRVPLLLMVHGVEAWTESRNRLVRTALKQVDIVVSVSHFTRERFSVWAGRFIRQTAVIPNCVDMDRFSPGPKDSTLLDRYRLAGRHVLLTVGRLSATERYKGIDTVIGVLPNLVREDPSLAYLIVGEGDDRPRLEALARRLGVANHVIFAGYIAESEKVDHYRLADVYVMPGRGEGFGIVYLESLACGIPAIASRADASREALDGAADFGEVVDPDDDAEIIAAIRRMLRRPSRARPANVETFSVDRFRARWRDMIDQLMGMQSRGSGVETGSIAPSSQSGFGSSDLRASREVSCDAWPGGLPRC